MDSTCPYTFTYKKIRENPANSKSTVIGFELMPMYQDQYRDPELERARLTAKVSVGIISPMVSMYMKQQMGIPADSLKPHKDLLMKACRLLPDILGTLAGIQGRRRKEDGSVMGVGWVIQAIRGEVKQAEKALKTKQGTEQKLYEEK